MLKSRFEDMLRYHTLVDPASPNLDEDLLFPVRAFESAWNANMVVAYTPSEHLTADKSMEEWRGKVNRFPFVKKIPRKPKPVGMEWKCAADAETFIMVRIEINKSAERQAHMCIILVMGCLVPVMEMFIF